LSIACGLARAEAAEEECENPISIDEYACLRSNLILASPISSFS